MRLSPAIDREQGKRATLTTPPASSLRSASKHDEEITA
jgi:hypothetical protein